MSLQGKPLSDDGLITIGERGQLMIWWREHGDSLSGTYTQDLRGCRCGICGQLWKLTGADWLNHTMTGEPLKRHVHRTCLQEHSTLQEASEWYALLSGSPLLFQDFKELPNKYWPDSHHYNAPSWFEVPLYLIDKDAERPKNDSDDYKRIGYGTMTLGWRKRVAHMELKLEEFISMEERTKPFTKEDIAGTFIEESDATKSIEGTRIMIHAWPGNMDEQRRKIFIAFAQILKRRFPNARFRRDFPEPVTPPTEPAAVALES